MFRGNLTDPSITTTPQPGTAPAVDSTGSTAEVDAPRDFASRVAELAETKYAELMALRAVQPPSQRRPKEELWDVAFKAASAEVRRQVARETGRRLAAKAATAARAEISSVVHRNRHQLAPWLIAAPYAGAGEIAALLAEYGTHSSPLGIGMLCGAATGAGSLMAWSRRLAKRVPAELSARVTAGMGALCTWSAAMPVVQPMVSGDGGQAGMWLALLGGTAYMGLPWWRRHAHPIPLPDDLTDLEIELAPTAADQLAVAERIIRDWEVFVAGQGTLPGSVLGSPAPVKAGWRFELRLVRGKQRLADVRAAKPAIAAALNLELGKVSVDAGPDQFVVELTVITETIATTYDGPQIVREGGDIYIELGPYQDGIGVERFHVLAGQLTPAQLAAGEVPRGSMFGGFALGTKGSGKSRLIEIIAVALRELGIEIWYLDPQEGASSPALMAEADWPFMGRDGTGGRFANIVDLWKAVKAVRDLRSIEGAAAGHQGFQHTRERPAIAVIIDECHSVFQEENPETGNSFGEDFAALDRQMRKNGIGLIGASQSITQDTFGQGTAAGTLRDGMCSENVFVMSYGGKNLSLVPGYDGQPAGSLPGGFGFGYNPKGKRPHVRWQTRYTPDYQPFLASRPKATLDARAAKVIGSAYLNRFVKYEADRGAAQAMLDAVDACEGDASSLLLRLTQLQAPRDSKTARATPELLSPAQRRMQANAPIIEGQDEELDDSDDEQEQEVLTDAEGRVLDIVQINPQTPTTLAVQLRVSSQAAGKHLRNLAAKGYLIKAEDGRYRPVTG